MHHTRPIDAVVAIIVGFLLCYSWSAVAVASQAGPHPSFRETYREWQDLCQSKTAEKAGWERVIRSFSRIAAESSDLSERKQSLFFAGKAALSLYERSGRPEDLETAIARLAEYARITGIRLSSRGPAVSKRSAVPQSKPPQFQAARSAVPSKRSNSSPAVNPSASAWQGPAGSAIPGSGPWKAGVKRSPPAAVMEEPPPGPVQQGNPFWPGPRPSYGQPARSERRVPASPPAPAGSAESAQQPLRAARRIFTVVIDPGHGGKDPGAVSRDGKVMEKDVTLNIARRMQQALEQRKTGIKVVLTRTDDKTMSLQSRTEFANALNADLFVSIHCNSIDDTVSKGIETFYLSRASCNKSMELAAKENGVSLSKMNDIQAALLNMDAGSKKTESHRLAQIIQDSIISHLGGPNASSIDRGVKQAPFHVLIGAKMPAVLVECAFISNPREKRKLQDPDYLNRVARGISEGAITYVTAATALASSDTRKKPVASTGPRRGTFQRRN